MAAKVYRFHNSLVAKEWVVRDPANLGKTLVVAATGLILFVLVMQHVTGLNGPWSMSLT